MSVGQYLRLHCESSTKSCVDAELMSLLYVIGYQPRGQVEHS